MRLSFICFPHGIWTSPLTARAMCGTHELNEPTRQIIPLFFDIGEAKGVTLSNIIISRRLLVIKGIDVWDVLNEKCG